VFGDSSHPKRHLRGQRSFGQIVCITLCMLGIASAQLPKQLQDALSESLEPGKGLQAAGVLRRYANSDEPRERVLSRTALARIDREAGHAQRAQTWVKEYSQPIPENYEWPRVAASIEYAQSAFALGQTFEAVKRLNGIKDHAQGLGRVYAQRALSLISEQQPDLRKALAFEKGALTTGKKYFKREKISESAGFAEHKAGHGHWKRLQPQIDERIKELERLLDIEKYGLDYVLYREAQMYRKADHPLAMDFTHVAAAFRLKEPMANKVPGADYEKALESYALLIESFDQNPYAEAAKFYSAVCKVHMGEADQAIRDLKAFYKENPDGLYRGEALKIIGDIYLFHKWDQLNAEEAYSRSISWLEAMKGRSRILNDYLVPEKSQKVSKPPIKVKVLTGSGQIKVISVPVNALANRNTSEWYLDALRVNLEWRLGFLDILRDDWDKALQHFDQVLAHDKVIRSANSKSYYNAYDRLTKAKRHRSMVGFAEQNEKLAHKEKVMIFWADLLYHTEQFERAKSIYMEIQRYTKDDNSIVYSRALLGEMLVRRRDRSLDRAAAATRIHEVIFEHPNTPSAPYLTELCGLYTLGKPNLSAAEYFRRIHMLYPESKFAPRGMYTEILRSNTWTDDEKRHKMVKAFKNKFPHRVDYIEMLEKRERLIMEDRLNEQKN